MKIIRRGFRVIREHLGLYAAVNLGYYGLVLVGMIYVSFHPELQELLASSVGEQFRSGSLGFVGEAYQSLSALRAFAVTFAVNLLLGTLVAIIIPGLIFPPFAVLMGIWRSLLWGLILAPLGDMATIMIPHSVVLLLEGQGYILAIFAVLVAFLGFLYPKRFGEESRFSGYGRAIVRTIPVYVLSALVLLVSAVYEALEVIILIKMGV